MTVAVEVALRVLTAGRVQEQKQHININNTPNFVAERYDAPCRDGQHK